MSRPSRSTVHLAILTSIFAGCSDARDGASAAAPMPASAAVAPANDGCLPYQPDTVHITGVMEQRMFYGRPNYGENPETDAKDWGYYVVPDAPVCTRGGSDPADDAMGDIRLVQLSLEPAGFAAVPPLLGRRVRVTGTMYGAFTGYHHAPVVISILAVAPADSAR
jgi:Domain of unknown function (DUF4431)